MKPWDASLAALHDALQSELAEIGFRREKRAFRPHITLGRVRSNSRLPALRAAFEEHRGFDAGDFPIDALTLFESDLRRSGARYTALGIHPLVGS